MSILNKIQDFLWFLWKKDIETNNFNETSFLKDNSFLDLILNKSENYKNPNKYMDLYKNNSFIYNPVSLIGKTIIKIDYWVYKNWKPNNNKQNIDILNKIDNNLIYWIVVNFLLFWEAYVEIIKIWNKVEGFQLLEPNKTFFKWESWTQNTNPEIYEYKNNWKIYKKEIKNLIVINNYSDKNKYRWVWSLESCIKQVELIEIINKWNRQQLNTWWKTWGKFKVPKKLTAQERNLLKEAFKNNHSWSDNVWKNVILWEGEEYEEFTNKMMEMDFVTLKTWAVEEVLASFGVNKWLIGKENNLNYATLEWYIKLFYDNVIEPLCIFISDWFNKSWIFDGEFIFLNIKSDKLDDVIAWYNAWLYTLNEARLKVWLQEIEWWNVLKSFWFNWIDNVKFDNIKLLKKEVKEKEKEKLKELKDLYIDFLFKTKQEIEKEKYWTDAYFQNQIDVMIDNITKKEEEEIKKALKNVFWKQKEDIIKIIEEKWYNIEEILKYFEETKDKNLQLYSAILLPWLKNYYKNWLKSTYKEFEDLNISWYIKIWDKKISENLNKQLTRLQKTLDEITAEKVINILKKEQELWLSVKEITKIISDKIEILNKNRIEKIVRTELLNAANTAKLDSYLANNDIVKWKQWFTAQDERICSNCWPMHWKVIPLNSNFYNLWDKTSWWLQIKYRNIDTPPLHPNCRCIIVPYIK